MNIFEAAEMGDLDRVKQLAKEGVELGEGIDLDEALFGASMKGHLPVVKFLVESGANVNKRNQDGNTPLFFAAFNAHLDVVSFLVEHGANVNEQSDFKDTPLFSATTIYTSERFEIAKFLLEKGADVNVLDKRGFDVVREATRCENGPLMELYIDHGANINAPFPSWFSPLSPLMEVTIKGNFQLVNLLIKKGADVHFKVHGEQTALDLAFEYEHYAVALLLQKYTKITNEQLPKFRVKFGKYTL